MKQDPFLKWKGEELFFTRDCAELIRLHSMVRSGLCIHPAWRMHEGMQDKRKENCSFFSIQQRDFYRGGGLGGLQQSYREKVNRWRLQHLYGRLYIPLDGQHRVKSIANSSNRCACIHPYHHVLSTCCKFIFCNWLMYYYSNRLVS